MDFVILVAFSDFLYRAGSWYRDRPKTSVFTLNGQLVFLIFAFLHLIITITMVILCHCLGMHFIIALSVLNSWIISWINVGIPCPGWWN